MILHLGHILAQGIYLGGGFPGRFLRCAGLYQGAIQGCSTH